MNEDTQNTNEVAGDLRKAVRTVYHQRLEEYAEINAQIQEAKQDIRFLRSKAKELRKFIELLEQTLDEEEAKS